MGSDGVIIVCFPFISIVENKVNEWILHPIEINIIADISEISSPKESGSTLFSYLYLLKHAVMKKIQLFILLGFSTSLFAQNLEVSKDAVKFITKKNLKHHVYILASDSLQGRNTGETGQKKAARYIAREFKTMGLKKVNNNYLHSFELWQRQWHDVYLEHNARRFNDLEQIAYLSFSPINEEIEKEVIFIGDGCNANLHARNLADKIVVASINNMRAWYPLADRLKKENPFGLFLFNPTDDLQFDVIKNQIIPLRHNKTISNKELRPTQSSAYQVFALNNNMTRELFSVPTDSLKQLSDAGTAYLIPATRIKLKCQMLIHKIETENIVGYLPGKAQTKETLVITAHYDHVGKIGDTIYYGADDNASGTATLLEIARSFTLLPDKTYKNILFVATTAEEKGMYGASYFMEHYDSTRYNILANINIDMVGRRDSVGKKNYIYLIGTEQFPEFDQLVTRANSLSHPLKLDYSYAHSSGFGSMLQLSDHYAFYNQNIPILCFFNGLHPDYHKPTDTPDKIEYNELEKRARLIFLTSYLAAQKEPFRN
ncbi:M28 family peptidase [Marinilabiliaceae bacterium JC017]|nr:M28 family peptidase [Marinilabiliaceae bacterium JC017]